MQDKELLLQNYLSYKRNAASLTRELLAFQKRYSSLAHTREYQQVITELEQAKQKKLDRCALVDKALASMDDEKLSKLIELRYICGYTWEVVADKMFYSLRYVMRLKKKAIAQLSL